MESFRGPETQVLRVKPSARLSRSWNPGLESETQCPFIEVLKPRFWEWNPAPVYRGPETQVLIVKPSVRLSRSWNPGPESQVSRFWNPGPESQMQQYALRYVKTRRQ
jgi:hypothetical protein